MTIVTASTPVAYESDRRRARPAFAARDPIVMVGDHEAEAGVLRLDPENLDDAGASTR